MMRLAFLAPSKEELLYKKELLEKRYGAVTPEMADVIIPLGGDGFMLHTLHHPPFQGKRFFGMNCGSVGFLMNPYNEESLEERVQNAQSTSLSSLEMKVETLQGDEHHAIAINEIYLFRETHQASKLRVTINGHAFLGELVSDGVL